MEKFPSPAITNDRTSLSLLALEDTRLWESAFCDFTKGSDAALILVLEPPIGADFQTKTAVFAQRKNRCFIQSAWRDFQVACDHMDQHRSSRYLLKRRASGGWGGRGQFVQKRTWFFFGSIQQMHQCWQTVVNRGLNMMGLLEEILVFWYLENLSNIDQY